MKTGIKTAAVLAAIIAGAGIAEAQQQTCPTCGSAKGKRAQPGRFQQRQGAPQQQFQRGAPGPQSRRFQANAAQRPQAARQGNPRVAPNAQQQNSRQQFQPPQGQQRRQFSPQQRQQILKRFDRDGDGQLSVQEKNAVKQQMQQRRSGNPGQQARRPQGQQFQRPNRQQQQVAPQQRAQMQQKRQRAMKRFDTDGNGQLSDQERAAARKQMQQRRQGAGSKPPKAQADAGQE